MKYLVATLWALVLIQVGLLVWQPSPFVAAMGAFTLMQAITSTVLWVAFR